MGVGRGQGETKGSWYRAYVYKVWLSCLHIGEAKGKETKVMSAVSFSSHSIVYLCAAWEVA